MEFTEWTLLPSLWHLKTKFFDCALAPFARKKEARNDMEKEYKTKEKDKGSKIWDNEEMGEKYRRGGRWEIHERAKEKKRYLYSRERQINRRCRDDWNKWKFYITLWEIIRGIYAPEKKER